VRHNRRKNNAWQPTTARRAATWAGQIAVFTARVGTAPGTEAITQAEQYARTASHRRAARMSSSQPHFSRANTEHQLPVLKCAEICNVFKVRKKYAEMRTIIYLN